MSGRVGADINGRQRTRVNRERGSGGHWTRQAHVRDGGARGSSSKRTSALSTTASKEMNEMKV